MLDLIYLDLVVKSPTGKISVDLTTLPLSEFYGCDKKLYGRCFGFQPSSSPHSSPFIFVLSFRTLTFFRSSFSHLSPFIFVLSFHVLALSGSSSSRLFPFIFVLSFYTLAFFESSSSSCFLVDLLVW